MANARNDAYTVLLFLSLAALIGGSTLLYLDFKSYGSPTPPAAGPIR